MSAASAHVAALGRRAGRGGPRTGQPDVRELLGRLIAFRTVPTSSNLECVDYIRNHLEVWGARCRLVPDASGSKASLVASFGPDREGGVVLSGHTDVVPVDGQAWSRDPWRLTADGGRLYGRGTTDMKGFLAAVMAIAPEAASRSLARPVHLAFSYDEEIGCLGAWPLADFIARSLPKPSAILVGEPTSLRVVGAHKGIATLRTTVRGYSVHSSQVPRGVSAVTVAARLVGWLDDLMAGFAASQRSGAFDPPHTTVQCGTILGGTAVNTVASDCSFTTDIRTIEGVDPRDVEAAYREHVAKVVVPAMRAVHSDCGVDVERLSYTPSLDPRPDGPAEALARRLTGDNSVRAVSYSTEAGVFQFEGFETVVCGPGSIDQAHQADEFIEETELDRTRGFLERVLDDLER